MSFQARLNLVLLVTLGMAGCASLPCDGRGYIKRTDRKIAAAAYVGGVPVALAGVGMGIAGVPFAVPVLLAGWASGMGGVGWLWYTDNNCKPWDGK